MQDVVCLKLRTHIGSVNNEVIIFFQGLGPRNISYFDSWSNVKMLPFTPGLYAVSGSDTLISWCRSSWTPNLGNSTFWKLHSNYMFTQSDVSAMWLS